MASPKIFSGARAIVKIGPQGGVLQTVGIFSSFSYNLTFSAQPVYTLGAYGAREIDYTAMETVQVSASGWRVIGQGPHVQALVPKVEDLLNHEYIEFLVLDRQTGRQIAHINNVRPLGVNTPIAARGLVEQSFSFMGTLVSDETSETGMNEISAENAFPNQG